MNHSLIDHCCSLTPTFNFVIAASLCTVQDPVTTIFITFEFKTIQGHYNSWNILKLKIKKALETA